MGSAPHRSEIEHLTFDGLNSRVRRDIMSFGIYAVGYLVLIAGVSYLAHLMHIPSHYIVAIALIMLGIGVVTGVQATRHKDPS
jgi:hypothetical protein